MTTSAATPIGRFTKKMPRQLMPVVMIPPEHRPESDGHPGDRTPDAESHPSLMAMEALGQQGQRGGEEDRPADALGAAGQDQHDRRLGHPTEQRPEGEDDEADGEQESPPVAIGQGAGGQQHRGQVRA